MTATVVAERVMKARHVSECPICQQTIGIGQRIAKCGYWMHLEPCFWVHRIDHQEHKQQDGTNG